MLVLNHFPLFDMGVPLLISGKQKTLAKQLNLAPARSPAW
jgi:hypothetical protein